MRRSSSPDGCGLAQMQDWVTGMVFAHLLGRVEGWFDQLPVPPSSLTPSWHDDTGDPEMQKRNAVPVQKNKGN